MQGDALMHEVMTEQAKKSKKKFIIDAETFSCDKQAVVRFLGDDHPEMFYQTMPIEERNQLMTSVWHLYYQGDETEKTMSLKGFDAVKDAARTELQRMCDVKTYKEEDAVRDLEMTYLYMGYRCGDKTITDLVKMAAIKQTEDMIHQMAQTIFKRPEAKNDKDDYVHDCYTKVLEMLAHYIPRTKFSTYARSYFKGGVIGHAASSHGMRKKDYVLLSHIESTRNELINCGYREPNVQLIADRMMLHEYRQHEEDPSYQMKKYTPELVFKTLSKKAEMVAFEKVENDSSLSDDSSDYVPGVRLEKQEEMDEFDEIVRSLPALEANLMLTVLTAYDAYAEEQEAKQQAMFDDYDAGKSNRSLAAIQKRRTREVPINYRNAWVRILYPTLSDDMIRKIYNSALSMIREAYKRKSRNRRYHLKPNFAPSQTALLRSQRLEKEARLSEEDALFESLGE